MVHYMIAININDSVRNEVSVFWGFRVFFCRYDLLKTIRQRYEVDTGTIVTGRKDIVNSKKETK